MAKEIKYIIEGNISDGEHVQEFTEKNIINIELEFGQEKIHINPCEEKLKKMKDWINNQLEKPLYPNERNDLLKIKQIMDQQS